MSKGRMLLAGIALTAILLVLVVATDDHETRPPVQPPPAAPPGTGSWEISEPAPLPDAKTLPPSQAEEETEVEVEAARPPEGPEALHPLSPDAATGELPTVPAARGVILPLPDGAKGDVRATVRRIWSGRVAQKWEGVRELPTKAGAFRLDDLEPGVYELEVSAEADGTLIRAKRSFEVGGGTAELGEIRLTRYAGIRARVVDSNGIPVFQADVVAVRTEEDPKDARRLTPDEGGWVTYGDLEPDCNHRVAVLGLPYPLDRVVRTPSRFGETTETEFRLPERLVDCRLRFFYRNPKVVDETGQMETRPLTSTPPPFPPSRFPLKDGVMHAHLLPGTYNLRPPHNLEGEAVLTIPDRESFEAKVIF